MKWHMVAAGGVVSAAWLTVGLAAALAGHETSVPGGPAAFGVAEPLVDCRVTGSGDALDRGFYLEHYPGFSLDTLTLWLTAEQTGAYTFRVTARTGAYDGPVLGSAVAGTSLVGNSPTPTPLLFDFGAIATVRGQVVTFVIEQTAGEGAVYYSTGNYPFVPAEPDPACPVTETEGTTPPLDQPRRRGMGVAITGFRGFVIISPGLAADRGD